MYFNNLNKNYVLRKCVAILVISLLVFGIVGCAKAPADGKVLTFADAQWDSIRIHNSIIGLIATEAYGYDSVDEITGSTPITFTALKNGEVDVYTELWKENISTYDQDLENGEFVELSINYSDNAQGFYVPRYVIEGDEERGIEPMAPDLKTVPDLKKYAEIFPNPENPGRARIVGAIPGWEADVYAKKIYEAYGLDEMYDYASPGGEPALAASLIGAITKGEPWLGYFWEPTYVSGKYDIVRLVDVPYSPELWEQGKCDFPSNNVSVGVSNQFAQKDPEFIEMLKNYSTSSEMTAKAIAYMTDNNADAEQTAKWFITYYKDEVLSMLPEDKAEIISKSIENWGISVEK